MSLPNMNEGGPGLLHGHRPGRLFFVLLLRVPRENAVSGPRLPSHEDN